MKHKIDCSDDILESIITGRELMIFESIKTWKKNTIALKTIIDGIAVEMGHKYIECGHCILIWESMMNHFVKNHEDKDAKD